MPRNSSYRNILVLGAGELGMPVIRELLQLKEADDTVSVLLPPSMPNAANDSALRVRASLRSLGVAIVEMDLATSDARQLSAVFSQFTQVIGCTGFVGGRGTQLKITTAALEADIEHYIPWQFGVDYDIVGHGSGQEVFDEQADVRALLRSQSRVKWTIVSTGMFTSFVFLSAFGLVDLQEGKVHALGDWSYRLTVTTPEDIGRMAALIALNHRRYSDQVVFLSGDTFTYAELADTVERVLGRPIERVLLSERELKAEVDAHRDDTMRKYRLGFARNDGVAWPETGTFNHHMRLAMVDLPTWLRRWRDHGGLLQPDWEYADMADVASRTIAKPEVLIDSAVCPEVSRGMADLVQRYYGWWNGDNEAISSNAMSSDFTDRTSPAGTPGDKASVEVSRDSFRKQFPNGRAHVLQQIIAGDRVVSHLRITGRLLGDRNGVLAKSQRIDYLATDILRIEEGLIAERWHLEDSLSLQRQLSWPPAVLP